MLKSGEVLTNEVPHSGHGSGFVNDQSVRARGRGVIARDGDAMLHGALEPAGGSAFARGTGGADREGEGDCPSSAMRYYHL